MFLHRGERLDLSPGPNSSPGFTVAWFTGGSILFSKFAWLRPELVHSLMGGGNLNYFECHDIPRFYVVHFPRRARNGQPSSVINFRMKHPFQLRHGTTEGMVKI